MLGQQILDLYRSIVDSSLRQMPFDTSSKEAFQTWQRKARRVVRMVSTA